MISSLQLAKLCGISQGTVDRALHDRPGVKPETKARILELARAHGYRPNPAARELLSGRSQTVGAVLPMFHSVFFLDLLNAVREKLAKAHLRLLLAPVATTEEFLQAVEDFAARRSRALLVVPPEDGLELPALVTQNLCVISLVGPTAGKNVHSLVPDEEQTGREAVKRLAALGHRRILHLTYARTAYAIQARARGYEAQMRALNLAPLTLIAPDENELLAKIAEHQATALFCHNDWLALGALRMLERRQIAVPGRISVLGVDGSPTFTALNADIATLVYPFEEIATQTCRLIAGERGILFQGSFKFSEKRSVGAAQA